MRYLEATFPSSRFNSRVVPVALLLPSRCASSCWYSVVPIDKMSSRPIPVACHVQCLLRRFKGKTRRDGRVGTLWWFYNVRDCHVHIALLEGGGGIKNITPAEQVRF